MSELNGFLRNIMALALVGVIVMLLHRQQYIVFVPSPQPPHDPSKEPVNQPVLRVEPKPQQQQAA